MSRGFKTLSALMTAGAIMTLSLASGPAMAETASASPCPRLKVRNADTGHGVMR